MPESDARSVKVPESESRSVEVPESDARSVKVPESESRSVEVPESDARSVKVPESDARSVQPAVCMVDVSSVSALDDQHVCVKCVSDRGATDVGASPLTLSLTR